MVYPDEQGDLLGQRSPPAWNEGDDIAHVPEAVQRGYTVKRKAVNSTLSIRQLSSPSEEGSLSSKPEQPTYETIPQSEQQEGQTPDFGGDYWLPGWWSQFPHRGYASLLGCIACIVGCIVVLVKSHDRPVSEWRALISPSVTLSILVTAINILARYAFREGVKISWWYKALRGGSVRSLHNHWAHTDSFWRALFAGRNFSLITISSIAVTIIVVDQPLLQRASTITNVPRNFSINVVAPIAPEVPWGFTGSLAGFGNDGGITSQVMTQPMISVFNEFNKRTPMQTAFTGCGGTCTGFVEAGGLASWCNTTTGPITYSFDNLQQTQYLSRSPFSVTFDMTRTASNVTSEIVMNVAYTHNSDGSSCSGTRTQRKCYLAPATLLYPITLVNQTATLGNVLSEGMIRSFQPDPLNFTWGSGGVSGGGFSYTTLGGIYLAANSLFKSNVNYDDDVKTGIYPELPDTLANQFLDVANQSLAGLPSSANLTYPVGCGLNWTDPTEYIVQSLNEIMFRLSLKTADFPYRNTTKPAAPQIIPMQETLSLNVYRTNWHYMISMVVITLVLLVLILPTFDGWSHLGRPMTLNPMETAKAFDAPLLQGPGSNATLGKLVDIYGQRQLKLGEVVYVDGDMYIRQLKLSDPTEVVKPRKGVTYV